MALLYNNATVDYPYYNDKPVTCVFFNKTLVRGPKIARMADDMVSYAVDAGRIAVDLKNTYTTWTDFDIDYDKSGCVYEQYWDTQQHTCGCGAGIRVIVTYPEFCTNHCYANSFDVCNDGCWKIDLIAKVNNISGVSKLVTYTGDYYCWAWGKYHPLEREILLKRYSGCGTACCRKFNQVNCLCMIVTGDGTQTGGFDNNHDKIPPDDIKHISNCCADNTTYVSSIDPQELYLCACINNRVYTKTVWKKYQEKYNWYNALVRLGKSSTMKGDPKLYYDCVPVYLSRECDAEDYVKVYTHSSFMKCNFVTSKDNCDYYWAMYEKNSKGEYVLTHCGNGLQGVYSSAMPIVAKLTKRAVSQGTGEFKLGLYNRVSCTTEYETEFSMPEELPKEEVSYAIPHGSYYINLKSFRDVVTAPLSCCNSTNDNEPYYKQTSFINCFYAENKWNNDLSSYDVRFEVYTNVCMAHWSNFLKLDLWKLPEIEDTYYYYIKVTPYVCWAGKVSFSDSLSNTFSGITNCNPIFECCGKITNETEMTAMLSCITTKKMMLHTPYLHTYKSSQWDETYPHPNKKGISEINVTNMVIKCVKVDIGISTRKCKFESPQGKYGYYCTYTLQ